MSDPVLVKLPTNFRRYPCPSSNDALEGSVSVDLGIWSIGGRNEQIILRVNGHDLPKLIQALADANGRCKIFAYGALECFVNAAYSGS